MKAGSIVPFIILGGVLQSAGAAMNGQLKQSLINPYLASAVSFALQSGQEAQGLRLSRAGNQEQAFSDDAISLVVAKAVRTTEDGESFPDEALVAASSIWVCYVADDGPATARRASRQSADRVSPSGV